MDPAEMIHVRQVEPMDGLWVRCAPHEHYRADRVIRAGVWYDRMLTEELIELPSSGETIVMCTDGWDKRLLVSTDSYIIGACFEHGIEWHDAFFAADDTVVRTNTNNSGWGYARICLGVWHTACHNCHIWPRHNIGPATQQHDPQCRRKIQDPRQWFGPPTPYTVRRLSCGYYVSERRSEDGGYSFRVTREEPQEFVYLLK
jgi:hypothetical protein